jgi:hypothetical protein
VRRGRTMTASAADFLACLALVHRLLGAHSPFDGRAPGGLDAALAEGGSILSAAPCGWTRCACPVGAGGGGAAAARGDGARDSGSALKSTLH